MPTIDRLLCAMMRLVRDWLGSARDAPIPLSELERLLELDDRTLDDIGVTRSDLQHRIEFYRRYRRFPP